MHSVDMSRRTGMAALAVLALALAGCTADHSSYKVGNHVFTAGDPPPSSARAAAPATASVDVAGRWTLAGADGQSCAVTFSGNPGATEGGVRPEGGCPGRLYTGRKWSLQQGALVIKDHKGAQLAQLAMSSPAQFAGQGVSGQQLTLSRL